MGYWGWRPLVLGLFISSWVVGCAVVPHSASPAAPSAYPEVTLTSGRLPAMPLPLLVATTPAPIDAPPFAPLNNQPPALSVGQPLCIREHDQRTTCIGRVDNPLDHPVSDVRLEARAITPDGEVSTSVIFPPALSVIPPGGFAPYSVTFDHSPALVDARAIDAAPAPPAPASPFDAAPVTLRAEAGAFTVRAIITNRSDQPQPLRSVLLLLLDGDARVITFRVLTFDDHLLDPAAALAVSALLMVPDEINGAVQVMVVVE